MNADADPLSVGDAVIVRDGPYAGRAGLVLYCSNGSLLVSLLATEKHWRIEVGFDGADLERFGRNTANPKILNDPERLDDVRAWIAKDAILDGADG